MNGKIISQPQPIENVIKTEKKNDDLKFRLGKRYKSVLHFLVIVGCASTTNLHTACCKYDS